MKRALLAVIGVLFGAELLGQSFQTTDSRVQRQSAHEKVWERVTEDEVGGQNRRETNSFVQLAAGLSRWSPEEDRWIDAEVEIEAVEGGAIARKTAYTVSFSANANNLDGTVHLITPEGKNLRSQLVGLAYTESTTGRSVFIAEVKETIGVIIGKDKVVYEDAFDSDIEADIVYSLSLAGIEQDLVIRGKIPSPENFGFDPAVTQLEVWTEFLQTPAPEIKKGFLNRARGRQVDDQISFGKMDIVLGRAFQLGNQDAPDYLVAKEWFGAENGMEFLIEALPYEEVAAELAELPQPAQAYVPRTNELEEAFASRTFDRRQRPLSFASVDRADKRQARREIGRDLLKGSKRVAMAQALDIPKPGFVLDYVMLQTISNYTLQGDTTYYINDAVTLSGAAVLEGGGGH